MNLQPLNDFVLLKPVAPVEVSAGGIILPESAKESPDEGVVEAIPADSEEDIAIGDRVIYKKYAGNEISFDGNKFKLVPTGDILAKYVESDAIPE